jgi:hypothetical protein
MRLAILWVILVLKVDVVNAGLCGRIYSKIRPKLTPEEEALIKLDQERLGLWRWAYRLTYADAQNSALKLRTTSSSIFAPSPSLKEQGKSALALLGHAFPKKVVLKLPQDVQLKMKSGIVDNFNSVVGNLVSILGGRPLYQLYPRYFTKVTTGKAHDLKIDQLAFQKVLKKIPEESFTRETLPITGIDRGFLFNVAWSSVASIPIVYAGSVVTQALKDEDFKNEMIKNKNTLINLLLTDYRYNSILVTIIERQKKKFPNQEFNPLDGIHIDDLFEVYKKYQSQKEFTAWILKNPKLEPYAFSDLLKLKHFEDLKPETKKSQEQLESLVHLRTRTQAGLNLLNTIDFRKLVHQKTIQDRYFRDLDFRFKEKANPQYSLLWEKIKNYEYVSAEELAEVANRDPYTFYLIDTLMTGRLSWTSSLLLGKAVNFEDSEPHELSLTEDELGFVQMFESAFVKKRLLPLLLIQAPKIETGDYTYFPRPTDPNPNELKRRLGQYFFEASRIEENIIQAKLSAEEADIYRSGKIKNLEDTIIEELTAIKKAKNR